MEQLVPLRDILGIISDDFKDVSKLPKYKDSGIEAVLASRFLPSDTEAYIEVVETFDENRIVINGPSIRISKALHEADWFDVFETVGNGIDFDITKYYGKESLSQSVFKMINSRYVINIKETPDEPIYIEYTTPCEEFTCAALVVNVLDGVEAEIIERFNSYSALNVSIDYSICKQARLNIATMHTSALSAVTMLYRYVYAGSNAEFTQYIMGYGNSCTIDETKLFPSVGSKINIDGAISTIDSKFTYILDVLPTMGDYRLQSFIYSMTSQSQGQFNHVALSKGLLDDGEIFASEFDVDNLSNELCKSKVFSFIKFINDTFVLERNTGSQYYYSLKQAFIKGI